MHADAKPTTHHAAAMSSAHTMQHPTWSAHLPESVPHQLNHCLTAETTPMPNALTTRGTANPACIGYPRCTGTRNSAPGGQTACCQGGTISKQRELPLSHNGSRSSFDHDLTMPADLKDH